MRNLATQTCVRINDVKKQNIELSNEKQKSSTRSKIIEEEIKKINKKLEAEIAKFRALTSSAKLFEGINFNDVKYSVLV